ncbi:hypothetical protein NT2_02_02230 [Caenibius tardaugens NBRC 16725]|uniref:Uncharacterized protein n=1 Tax=Caenibius tardaugens NBRC 16725 TaxID=1219035 RepID=U2Y4V0_9SPHN|nr:hypothetical protein [Caenibius tardaugens]GAD48141.1 hypothetical protein NT2_02_02230 [Caenibius tardaugens NBRC 16725]
MDMLDTLRRTGGLSALTVRLGFLPAQAAAAAEALAPCLIAGYGRSLRRLGEEAFTVQLESLGGEEMAQAVLLPGPIHPSVGDAALRLAFGSSENVDRVESAVQANVTLDPPCHRDVLRLLAMLLGGYLLARADRADFGHKDGLSLLLSRGAADEWLDATLGPEDE